MADLNKVFLIGRLTQDPELRYTPGGAAVADLRLATSRQYQAKDGSTQKDTLYIDVTVWNRAAENCCQFLKKGRQIHVEGFLKMDTWEDKQTGAQRSKIRVEAERVQFLDRREDSGGPHEGDDEPPPPQARRVSSDGRPAATANGVSPRDVPSPSTASAARRPTPPPPPDEADDDIPF